MPLVETMPDWLTAYLAERGPAPDDLIVAAATDLDVDGSFNEQWFLTSDRTAWIVARDGEKVETRWTKDLSDIEEFVASTRVGSGFLDVKIDGTTQSVLRYSNAGTKRFAQIAKALSDFIKDGTALKESDEDEQNVCPDCGTAYMEGSTVCPKCMSKFRTFMRLFGYARSYRITILILILFMTAGTALQFAPPLIVREILDGVLIGRPGSSPADPTGRLLFLTLMLLAAHAAAALLRILHGRLAATVGAGMVFDFRRDAYANLQQLSLSFYDKRQVGALMSRITHDTDMVQHFIVDGIQYIFMNTLKLILVAAIMFWHSPKLAVLALVTAPIVVCLSRLFIKKLMMLLHRFFDYRSRFHALVNDALSGIRVVKAFAREDWEVDRYQQRNRSLCDATVTVEKAFTTLFPSLHFLSTIGSVLVWLVGGYAVIANDISVGTFMMFVYLLGMLQGPLEGLSRIHHWISRSLAGAERVFEIVDASPDVKDPENPVDISNLPADVAFDHVTFGYDKYTPVLKDLNLSVKAGEMIGFVGHSGAGKTTAANLICRFYDPDEGRVLVGGVDLTDVRRSDYGKSLGVVLQEPFLFNGTIRENIAYGKPHAEPEEIMRAARIANAHDFIVDKPDGYDSQVGEGGKLISVGEKQRISIARAILHDPKILILDEATASVDTDTEKLIQEALARLVKGRTTFAIAHRLSTLRMSDRLVVIKDGVIEESGSHSELMKKKGEYHRLVKMQSDMARTKTVGG